MVDRNQEELELEQQLGVGYPVDRG